MPANGKSMDSSDPDSNLVPCLIESVGLPRVMHALQHRWDPASQSETSRAAAAVQELLIYVDATSEKLQELLGVVRRRLEQAAVSLRV